MLDSTILIDATRGLPAAISFLEAAAELGELWSVTPVRTEVGWGLRADEQDRMERLFRSIRWLEISETLAGRAAQHGRRWSRSHGLGVIDALLAAAAEEVDAQVATHNVRDFPMFPGIEPPY